MQRERYVAGYLNELQELFDIEREIADEAKMPEQNDDAENISRPIFPAPSDPFLENNEPPESHQNFTARRRRNKSNATTVDAPNFDREMTKQWIQKVWIVNMLPVVLPYSIGFRFIFPTARNAYFKNIVD
jgi:hypothetical protein